MDQNPLGQLLAGYFRRGEKVRELLLDQQFEPTGVLVVLENGREYQHAVATNERLSLPGWLTEAQMSLVCMRAA